MFTSLFNGFPDPTTPPTWQLCDLGKTIQIEYSLLKLFSGFSVKLEWNLNSWDSLQDLHKVAFVCLSSHFTAVPPPPSPITTFQWLWFPFCLRMSSFWVSQLYQNSSLGLQNWYCCKRVQNHKATSQRRLCWVLSQGLCTCCFFFLDYSTPHLCEAVSFPSLESQY